MSDDSWLARPLEQLVGKQAAKLRTGLDLHTAGDLIRHYPRRYERYGELTPIAGLPLGEEVTIVAEIARADSRPMRQRRGELLKLIVTDGTDTLELAFFNAGRLKHALTPGRRALFSGTVSVYNRTRQLAHPRYELLDGDNPEDAALARLDKPVPIYPATKGIESWQIARAVHLVVAGLGEVPDPIPAEVRARRGLIGETEALRAVHAPQDEQEAYRARHRLRFEEAFVLQAALARRRAAAVALPATAYRRLPGGLAAAFDERLPFELTAGQRQVGEEVEQDLAEEHPMQRLLQGEVGSGKTVVALRAMLTVVDSGGQAALLAPTEVLAAQHLRSITTMLGDLAAGGMLGGDERGTRVVLLTGSMPAAARRRALLEAASGQAGIVVGTHALLQEKVGFADLGLVVVDEQHRFGVEQRDALRAKGGGGQQALSPHLLVMTATPIPRTVAMTVFGDLAISELAELPAGRAPISTHVIPVRERPAWLDRAWQRVREEVAAGHQAYVVCPRIGDGEGADEMPVDLADDPDGPPRRTRAVLEVLEELRRHPETSALRLAMLHGRMPADERESVMASVAAGDVDVLVATTVIEVGVDVPNATAMVVLDADRFGVSQLHQLRGRVGRGSAPGLCLLVTESDDGTPARVRLDAVAATTDGFQLAKVDLEQRREGDILGAAQSGRSSLKLLRVVRDQELIEQARHDAADVVAADPQLRDNPTLAAAIEQLVGEDREAYLERA